MDLDLGSVIVDMRKITILEGSCLNTYVLSVIHEDSRFLIGDPIKNSNKRIRVDKMEENVEILPDTRYAQKSSEKYDLEKVTDSIPDWAKE